MFLERGFVFIENTVKSTITVLILVFLAEFFKMGFLNLVHMWSFTPKMSTFWRILLKIVGFGDIWLYLFWSLLAITVYSVLEFVSICDGMLKVCTLKNIAQYSLWQKKKSLDLSTAIDLHILVLIDGFT